MRLAKTLFGVFGAIVAFVAIGLSLGGVALLLVHLTQRDDTGYYHSSTERLTTPTYAITSAHLDLAAGTSPADWATAHYGTVRIRAAAAGGTGIFVGVARTADVHRYLAGSSHDELTAASFHPFRATFARHDGEARPGAPASESFWAASATGPGQQTVFWQATGGDWAVVVMNADAAPGVAVDTSIGVRTGLLLPIGLLAGGLLVGAIAAAFLVSAVRTPAPPPIPPAHPQTQPAGPTEPVPGVPNGYPVRLDGRLDEGLSRWLWLVKWLLVLPHLFVLAFLWLTFFVLTVVAGVAILFTGRYPRGIFDFNVGVLRWTWRVAFYATTFGTDRYPPFSLDSDPTYPADLQVEYPARLSRSLVLIKWWLLALPHYLVISIFGGGLTWWTWDWTADNDGRAVLGAGLIGLLAVIAAVTLAFTARYPRSLFDFLMGMQRWTYRWSPTRP